MILVGFLYSNLTNLSTNFVSLQILKPFMGSIVFGIGSMAFASLIGTLIAIYFECYQSSKSSFIKYIFALPLAFPLYVFSFIYVGAFEYSSWISTALRGFGMELPSIRNLLGASFIAGLCLYPYVFLVVSAHLRIIYPKYYWASKTLGLSDIQMISRVLLPALKPSIITGSMLVMFESLADFGAVKALGIETLTTAIYSQWFGMQDFVGGSRLALLLLLIVLFFIFMQKHFTRDSDIQKIKSIKNIKLVSGKAVLTTAAIFIGLLAILFPFTQLIAWVDLEQVIREFRVNNLFINSLTLAVFGSLIVLLIGIAVAFVNLQDNKSNHLINLTTYGYALPGSLIAVALLVGFKTMFQLSLTNLGIIGLILALSIRFLTPAKNYFIQSLGMIPRNSIHTLALSNASPWKSFIKFYWKHIRYTSLLVFFIVAIEILKEQPAVLLLRPVGFDTLSSRIYNYTSEGQWELAAQPSILLVCIGVFFVIMLTRIQDRHE